MKRFIHEHYALLVGITLPLALMVIFFIAGNTARVQVADPLYDMLYTTDYYDGANQPYNLRITDGKLIITVDPDHQKDTYNIPKLYIFDHKTLTSNRIDIDFKNVVDGRVADTALAELNKNILSTTSESPDGYRFEYNSRYNNGGIAGDLFGFGRNYGSSYVLQKSPRYIELNAGQPVYNGRFLAWVNTQ